MLREELMKQLFDLLENGAEIEKVKITYKNGAAVKIDFDDDDDEDDDEDEDEDEDDDDDDDDDDDQEDGGVEEVVVEDKVENDDSLQETGWKVNIINQ